MGLGLASLVGTLGGNQLIDQRERENNEQIEELNRTASAAAQQSQQSQQQLQQAAGAPPPEVPTGERFVQTLLSNIASTVAQDPKFRQRAELQLRQKQQDLMTARKENLSSLSQTFQERARAAREAGDRAAEAEIMLKKDSFDKQLGVILEKERQEHGQRMQDARIQAQHDSDEFNRVSHERAAQIGRGIDPNTGEPLPEEQRPKSATERGALVRQGIDPDTGFLISARANRDVTEAAKLARGGKNEDIRNSALNQMFEIATQRWETDRTPALMGIRLLKMRHPFFSREPKEARYAVTNEPIFKQKNFGRVERDKNGTPVVDPEAEARAKQAINGLVAPWFEQDAAQEPAGQGQPQIQAQAQLAPTSGANVGANNPLGDVRLETRGFPGR